MRGAAVASSLGEGVNAEDLLAGSSINPVTGRPRFPDLSRREVAVLAPLVVLIIGLGVYPKPVLDVITPSVNATMTEVGLTDPVTAQPGGK